MRSYEIVMTLVIASCCHFVEMKMVFYICVMFQCDFGLKKLNMTSYFKLIFQVTFLLPYNSCEKLD